MVKSAAARTAKAQAKIDPVVVGQRLTAMQTQMSDNAATAQSDGYTIASTVRGILNQYAISGNFANTFQAFANELASKQRRFSGVAYATEGAIVLAKWKLRCTISGSIPASFVNVLTLICQSYGITYA
jgi:hypothetical protein